MTFASPRQRSRLVVIMWNDLQYGYVKEGSILPFHRLQTMKKRGLTAPASFLFKTGKLGYHISRPPTSGSELSGSLISEKANL